LHNTYVLEVERVVRYLTAIQNNTDFITVGCDDFCFHEAKRGLQDLIKGTCRVRVVRVQFKHRGTAIDKENNGVLLVFKKLSLFRVHACELEHVFCTIDCAAILCVISSIIVKE
jgi:hypothetical protein